MIPLGEKWPPLSAGKVLKPVMDDDPSPRLTGSTNALVSTNEDDDNKDDDDKDDAANPSGVVVVPRSSSLFNIDFSFSMATFVARVLLVSSATAVAVVIITNNKNLRISILMVLFVTIIILWKRTKYWSRLV